MDLVAPNTISSGLFPGELMRARLASTSAPGADISVWLQRCWGSLVVRARVPANASKSLCAGEPHYGTFLLVTGLGYQSCREQ